MPSTCQLYYAVVKENQKIMQTIMPLPACTGIFQADFYACMKIKIYFVLAQSFLSYKRFLEKFFFNLTFAAEL